MKRLATLILVLSLAIVFGGHQVQADVNDFVINDFHGRYQLHNDVNGGRMSVTETIQVTFSDQNHGILRAIPVDYRGNSLKLKIDSVKRDGQAEPFSTYNEANNKVLKIGDPKRTITGQHTYEISYGMQNIIGFFENYDEWYWDINGDQWGQKFEKVSGEVVLPAGWDYQGLPSPSCYTGNGEGAQLVCSILRGESGYRFTAGKQMSAGETLTVAVPVQKGLFKPRTGQDWLRDNIWQFVGVLSGIGLSFVAILQWYKWGKDHKGSGIIIPEYRPPAGLSPAEVGLLNDYSVDSRDLTAIIIDLAIRGYIKIHDQEKKTLGFTSHNFELELINDKTGNLKNYEKKLVETIFGNGAKGTKKEISKIDKTKMYRSVQEIRALLKKSLIKDHGYIDEVPTRAYVALALIMGVSVVMIPVTRAGWGWIVGMALSGIVALICLLLIRRRTHAGEKVYEKIKGLKLYMDTAEKDRLKMMESVDRPYAEPTHDYKFFEKLLPYAVALGVEKSWAKQFDNVYREPPEWYSGNQATFNTVFFTNSLASGISSFNSSFSTSTSSSTSGSGGGGFSGGGGGGGGGGGW